jgi:multisubunit Na+/H+ antiporter MnhE subunit
VTGRRSVVAHTGRRWVSALVEFTVLLTVWLLLSDQRGWLFLAMGIGSAALVTALTHSVVVDVLGEPAGRVGSLITRVGWAVVFLAWVSWSIVVASTQIAYLVVNRRRPFRPHFVVFDCGLRRPLSRALLALTITLVPGTMTVRQSGGRYLVHVLVEGGADDLASGRLQTLIGRIAGEGPQPAPEMHWGPLIEEAVR